MFRFQLPVLAMVASCLFTADVTLGFSSSSMGRRQASPRSSLAFVSSKSSSSTTQLHASWPFRIRTSEESRSGVSGGDHLIVAGREIQSAASSQGGNQHGIMAGPSLLEEAGESIVEIGISWMDNWEAVLYAAEETATSLKLLAQVQASVELQKLYSGAAGSFRGISALRPTTTASSFDTAVPYLTQVSQYLVEIGKYYAKDKNDKQAGKALQRASKSINALVREYS